MKLVLGFVSATSVCGCANDDPPEGRANGHVDTFNCLPPSGPPPGLRLTSIATGLDKPLFVVSPPGDASRLMIVEQSGTVRVLEGGVLLQEPFLAIQDRVTTVGEEQGLLGLAFHPDYTNNGRFFVHYSTVATGSFEAGDTVIAEFRRSIEHPHQADPRSERGILWVHQPEANHNGGSIEFGPDGFLYIALGDGGGGGDIHGEVGSGQDLSVLLGKILRIDIDVPAGDAPYRIPPGNMSASGVKPEIWSYGLRNPWRVSFDACTGDLYIADVGQDFWEELDIEPMGDGGKNYGWRRLEASRCFKPEEACDPTATTTLPVLEYGHDLDGGCSITGGYVYRGSRIPGLRGTYLYADYWSWNFFTLDYKNGKAENVRQITADINTQQIHWISSLGQDAAGELYVASLDGRVFRVDPD